MQVNRGNPTPNAEITGPGELIFEYAPMATIDEAIRRSSISTQYHSGLFGCKKVYNFFG